MCLSGCVQALGVRSVLTVSSVEVDVDLQAMDWLDREVGHTTIIEPLISRGTSSTTA